MPIDAAIPLAAQGVPPLVNPMQVYAQAQQMQLAREQQRALEEQRQSLAAERAQQTAKLAQQNADAQAFADSIRQGNGVRAATMNYATKNHPGLVPELQKYFDAADESAGKIQKTRAELQNMQLDHIGHTADWLLTHASDPAMLPGAIGMALAHHAELFPDEAQQVQQLGAQLHGMSPEQQKAFLEQTRATAPYYQGEQAKIAEKGPTIVPEGAIAINPSGQTIATGAPKPTNLEQKSGTLNGKEITYSYDPHTGKSSYQGQDVTDQVKPMPPAAMRVTVNPEQQGNASAIADAIEQGLQPPDVKGLYRFAGPVRAELAKRGYDMNTANLDWQAAQKHFATLNGQQQTRIRQAVDTATHSLDVIDSLADQWKGGKYPLLNRANLALAKNGAFGQQAQSIATQLEGQITDVTSELGQVYMGGNSPTDHALELAGKNLRGEWSNQTLHDMTNLARTNLKIRSNAIANVGTISPSGAANPYAPSGGGQAAPPAGTESLEHRVWRVGGKVGPEPK